MPQRYIDGFEFAGTGGTCRGAWPIADLPRLQDIVRGNAGEVEYAVDGIRDSLGRPALRVKVGGVLQLTCQRCLEAMPYRIDTESILVLARNEAEAEAGEIDVEGPDRIVAAQEMPVRDLIEDEVLLAVPVALRHDRCEEARGAGQAKGSLPFAGLKGLLGDH